MARQPCVYILASARNGTLYIGVTSNLMARLHQHRTTATPGFTSRYGVPSPRPLRDVRHHGRRDRTRKAAQRWRREWKLNLIEQDNPDWVDLAIGLGFDPVGRASPTLDAETSSA